MSSLKVFKTCKFPKKSRLGLQGKNKNCKVICFKVNKNSLEVEKVSIKVVRTF